MKRNRMKNRVGRRLAGIASLLACLWVPLFSVLAWDWPIWGGGKATQSDRSESRFTTTRRAMVEKQLRGRDIDDALLLNAMATVPRHRFIPKDFWPEAYADHPLPIGFGQTISQPYIVAFMCQLARIGGSDRVLEVGSGSGYHAAVISRLAKDVHSIEIVPQLAERARRVVRELAYVNVTVENGDGYFGRRDKAPFDVIVVTAASDHIPPPLIRQLAEGGRMVIPVGQPFLTQMLVLVEKNSGKVRSREILPVRFVPLTGGDH